MDRRNSRIRIVFVAVVLILVLLMVYSGLRILESTVFVSSHSQTPAKSKVINRNGVDYFPRQDIDVILVLGIDEFGPVTSSGSYRNNGESDMVSLLILDHSEKVYRVLCINRDTMLHMPALGLGGKKAGTYFGQLALSHTYGSGLMDSAENTREAVSNLLYGLNIDRYVSVNMDAIQLLNDMVGGVTVNVTDDFSAVDPTITMGTVTLNSDQALTFVQTRKDVGSQLNLSRMERHKEYMHGLVTAITDKLSQSDSFAGDMYEAIEEYMVTDCSMNMFSGFIRRCADYELAEIISISGENVLGKEYYEFYPDEDALDALVLRLFYAPK